MNYFSKIKLGAWIVIILTIINVATLSTILYKNQKQKYKVEKPNINRQKQRLQSFLQEMKLTEGQQAFYNNSLCTYFDSTVVIFHRQEALRLKIIEELSTDHPDTTLLFSLSNTMGNNYIQLKKSLIRHFIGTREICSPEQKKMLNPLYSRLIGPEGSCNIKRKAAFCNDSITNN
jgi:hypothetical protein